MVTSNYSNEIEEAKKRGVTKLIRNKDKAFHTKVYSLGIMDVLEPCNEDSPDEVMTSNILEVSSCMAHTIQGACEAFRNDIFNFIAMGFAMVEDSKIFLSEAFVIEDATYARVIVASFRLEGGEKAVKEFYVMEKETSDKLMADEEEIELVSIAK